LEKELAIWNVMPAGNFAEELYIQLHQILLIAARCLIITNILSANNLNNAMMQQGKALPSYFTWRTDLQKQ
jgi:hypothetical protein